MYSVIILKPTKECNADCSYCSSPPTDQFKWTPEIFRSFMENMSSSLEEDATIIWHGGEPMLMGPEFFEAVFDIAKEFKPKIRFSLQSNLLLYKSARWKSVFENIFQGSVSTSYDPDEENRTIKGNAAKYTKTFWAKLQEIHEDGFNPLVIGTYTNESIHLVHELYDYCLSNPENSFSFRVNYRYPAGRLEGSAPPIDPKVYGDELIKLYNRWIVDCPNFLITPLDQMLKKILSPNISTCPWTKM